MREDAWEFAPSHKLWLVANHKPIIKCTDYAMWRRIKLIPFTTTIADDRKDPKLLEKLIAELPGILRWAIEGCLAWQQGGLQEPKEIADAVQAYRLEMDVVYGARAEALAETLEPADLVTGQGKLGWRAPPATKMAPKPAGKLVVLA